MYINKLKIGNVELDNNIILAPMAGVTDLPFRKICKKYGNAGLLFTEMASSKAIYYGDEKTDKIIRTEKDIKPIAIQIFGSDPEIMASSAKKIEKYRLVCFLSFLGRRFHETSFLFSFGFYFTFRNYFVRRQEKD